MKKRMRKGGKRALPSILKLQGLGTKRTFFWENLQEINLKVFPFSPRTPWPHFLTISDGKRTLERNSPRSLSSNASVGCFFLKHRDPFSTNCTLLGVALRNKDVCKSLNLLEIRMVNVHGEKILEMTTRTCLARLLKGFLPGFSQICGKSRFGNHFHCI